MKYLQICGESIRAGGGTVALACSGARGWAGPRAGVGEPQGQWGADPQVQ